MDVDERSHSAVRDVPDFDPFPDKGLVERERILVSRRECTWLGMKIYLLGILTPFVLAGLHYSFSHGFDTSGDLAMARQLFLAVYMTVPPIALLGGVMGFEAFRMIADGRKPKRISPIVWIILTVFTLPLYGAALWFVVPCYLHGRLRRLAFEGERKDEVGTALLHLAYMFIWPFAVLYGTGQLLDALQPGSSPAALGMPCLICAIPVLWICDQILLISIASWRSGGILAPNPSEVWQYSLGALLIGVLGVGTWVSGIVLMLRNGVGF